MNTNTMKLNTSVKDYVGNRRPIVNDEIKDINDQNKRNEVMLDFLYRINIGAFFDININNIKNGSSALIFKIQSNTLRNNINNFITQKRNQISDVYMSNINLPDFLSMKVQFSFNVEVDILREEKIMRKLESCSDLETIIPKIYTGFTYLYLLNGFKHSDNSNSFDAYVKVRFTFMDWFDGMTINTYIRERIKIQHIVKLIDELQDIIQKLWTCGVSHNDISGNNIIVDNDGHIKLIDFGLSTSIDLSLNQSNETMINLYKKYYRDRSDNNKNQNGSNVTKIKEILSFFKDSSDYNNSKKEIEDRFAKLDGGRQHI